MEIKYSKGFERDYNFYLKNLDEFNFCGTLNPKHEAMYSPTGISAKQCFYCIESYGKNKLCNDPQLLNALLLTKASINFQIKEWAAGRADGTLSLVEFSKRLMTMQYPDIPINQDCKLLAWVNNEPTYYSDIETQYGLPDWVIDATEKQKVKLWR